MKHELSVELTGASALNPDREHDHSAREAMFTTQIGQTPVIRGNTPRFHMTGAETQYAEHTFDVRVPENITVLRVLRKYNPGLAGDSIRRNPEMTVLYEEYNEARTIGILKIPEYQSLHPDFGFPLIPNRPTMERLRPKETLGKGEVLATSPAVRQNGQYGLGIEANVAFLSHEGTIEDGFVVSSEFLKKMQAYGYHTHTANWGSRYFPLNLYGDEHHYKPYPDIGDKVRPDGLIFALREYDPDLAVTEMTPAALREVDPFFDKLTYGEPNATVIDVTVYHDERINPPPTPTGMETQAAKYYESLKTYYQTLLDEYHRLKGRRGKNLHITREFSQALVEAQIYLPVVGRPGQAPPKKLTRMHRLEQLDEWRVEVTYEYILDPTDGYKLSDCHGGNVH